MRRVVRDRDAIAVIGMSCRFPHAPDPSSFWDLLSSGRDALTLLDDDELLASGVDRRLLDDPAYVKAAMILEDVESFDAEFFGIPEGEARMMDPQQRLLLECAWEALESSGQLVRSPDSRVGVWVGARLSEYMLHHSLVPDLFGHTGDSPVEGFRRLLVNDKDYLATRLAYLLDLRGPAITVQTACSTSLVAVHSACQSLLLGECDVALAGGASVRVPQRAGYVWSEGMIYSPDGRTRPFDARAAGTIFGSGAGVVALKRLSDARADGDPIVAVIRGSAVNNDGAGPKAAFSAPSFDGQVAVIAEALAVAELSGCDISYVEAHGTGTAVGDPIEISALAEVFRADGATPGSCSIGSVKSNVGHLVQAAGIAGLIKTCLMLERRSLVPSANFTVPNPLIGLERTPFVVSTETKPWTCEGRRRAGISAFGFGGTNAHVILEEAPRDDRPSMRQPAAYVLPVSAKSPEAVRELVSRYETFLRSGPGASIAEICASAQRDRIHFPFRVAASGSSGDELSDALRRRSDSNPPRAHDAPVRVGFVFSGQGSQYPGMGRSLYEREPTFRRVIDECADILSDEIDRCLPDFFFGKDAERLQERTDLAQPALVAFGAALVAMWRAWGVEPALVVGHSLGELTAAWSAGAYSLGEILRLAAARGRLMQAHGSPGAMATVFAREEEVASRIAGSDGTLSIAAVNAPGQTVVSGASEAIQELVSLLSNDSIHARRLNVGCAFHSPLMDALLDDLGRVAATLHPAPPTITMITSLGGKAIDGSTDWPDYWKRQCREPVRFADAARAASLECSVLLEIGGDAVLTSIARSSVESGPTLVSSLRKGRDDLHHLGIAAADLWMAGVEIDWEALGGESGGRRKAVLPTYPFQRKRCWLEKPVDRAVSTPAEPMLHPILGHRISSPLEQAQYENRIDVGFAPYARDHLVLGMRPLVGVAHMETMRAAAADALGLESSVVLEDVVIETPILLDERPHNLHVVVDPRPDGAEVRIHGNAESTENEWVLHSSARARAAEGAPHRFDVDEIRRRCIEAMPLDHVEARKRKKGANVGPSLLTAKRVSRGDGEVLVELSIEVDVADFADYGAHPAVLNAAPHYADLTLSDFSSRADLFLPTVAERVTFRGSLPRRTLVWLTLREAGDQIYGIDCRFMDESGVALVEMEGLFLKRATPSTLGRSREDGADPSYEPRWVAFPPTPTSEPPRGRWLILADESGVTTTVERILNERGATAIEARAAVGFERKADGSFVVDPSDKKTLASLVREVSSRDRPIEGILCGWGLDASDLEDGSNVAIATLHLAQVLSEIDPPTVELVFLTRGAQATGLETAPLHPEQSPLWGFVRALRKEQPARRCRLIDLDPTSSAAESEMLWNALQSEEDEIALRNDGYLGLRLERLGRAPRQVRPARLEKGGESTIEGLSIRPMKRRAPGRGEIEIEVRSTGLNFRDVLNATGRLRGPLGHECAGVVSACGDDVASFAVGDRVMALAEGSMATHVLADARLACRIPADLSFAQASSTLMVFVTAWLGLVRRARLERGERVLIHTAAGGVGQAAIEIVRAHGGEIYATASERKWPWLAARGVDWVRSSRKAGFSRDLLAATGGEGVDIVLNTLGEPFFDESLSVLKRGGRWIELGHPDVIDFDSLSRKVSAKGVELISFHTARVGSEDPAMIGECIASLGEWFERDRLRPVPHRSVPIDRAAEAFETMLRGGQTGKLALVQPCPAGRDATFVRDDATYLITGGTGAVGLSAAQWLAGLGARSIALMARSAPSDRAREVIEEIEKRGVSIELIAGDMAERVSVERVLAVIAERMPPLRGVIHAAGITDDAAIPRLDRERFASVLAPKIAGAWNLHVATRSIPLDLFVLVSSVAGLWGNAGQTGYAAANAFLDQLAHQRRQFGLPALSVDYGLWKGRGMGAALPDSIRRRREESGLGELDPQVAFEELSRALEEDRTQVVVAVVDWSRFVRKLDRVPSMFSRLATARPKSTWHVSPSEAGGSAAVPPASLDDAIVRIRRHVDSFVSGDLDETDLTRPLPDLGLDSLTVLLLRGRLAEEFGAAGSIPVVRFLEGRSIVDLARVIAANSAAPARGSAPSGPAVIDVSRLGTPEPTVVGFATAGDRPAFLLVPPAGIMIGRFSWLADYVDAGRPFYGLNPIGFDGRRTPHDDVPTMARHYLAEIGGHHSGPYVVGGICFGAWVALEMALALEESGRGAPHLIAIDYAPPSLELGARSIATAIRYYGNRIRHHLFHRSLQRALADRARRTRRSLLGEPVARDVRWYVGDDEAVADARRVLAAHAKAARTYRTRRFGGDVTVVLGGDRDPGHNDAVFERWRATARGSVRAVFLDQVSHTGLLDGTHADVLGLTLRQILDESV